MAQDLAHDSAHDVHDDHNHAPTGIKRWLFSTNHKDIGTMYLVFSLIMFFFGGAMAMVIRAELFKPGLQIVDPERFNQMTTMHALVMIFGAVMPSFVGLANWMVPLQIGAPDMALPRMNNLSFWILPFAFTILLSTLLMPGGAPAAGWTMYPPLVLQSGDSMPMLIFAVHLMGASSIMGAINIVVTIMNMRAPGMNLLKMPLFCWSWLITAYLLIAVMPAFGIISEILPTFARKPLFGATSMIYAIASTAFLSFIVWGHHMFVDGMPMAAQLFYMMSTMLIAVPTGVKVFNWTATLWKGSLTFEPPMLFALAFLFLFSIGGFSGLMLALTPVDFQYNNTYFVVAHFHYVLVPGAIFAVMAAVYYWLPKWTGHMYNMTLAKTHFWLSAIFVNVLFFPQHFLGLAGMPRRIPDYAVQFTDWNMVSSLGGFGFGLSQILFAIVIVQCIRGGKKATAKVWDDARPHGLEWTLSSPPPYHSFTTAPDVK